MTQHQSTLHVGPIFSTQDGERCLATVRARLQDIFGEIHLVRDVITISIEAMHTELSNCQPEMGRVLFHCGAEKRYGQLQSLSELIEQLGGRTEFTEDRKQGPWRSAGEVDHVDN